MLSFKEHIAEEIHAPGTKVAFPHKGKMTSGKVVRFQKGSLHQAAHYVIYHGEYQSAEVPPHKVEKYTPLGEAVDPKFERATKTSYHYTGKINGKTYVVPHSYNYEQKTSDKVTPMHHHIVVSLNHVIHNNPSLKPEEHARIHQHILDIHGGQESAKTVIHEALRKNLRSQSDIDKFASRGRAAKNLLGLPQSLGKLVREAINHGDEVQISDHYGLDRRQRGIVLHPNKVRTNGRGVPTDVPGAYKPVDHKKEHVVKLHNGSHAVVPKRLLTKVLKEETEKPVKGTPEYQKERDKYRHAALAASRKAATLAFAKKHHIINETEDTMNEGAKSFHDVATLRQTKVAKQSLRMPDAMLGVMGGGSKEDARAHLKKMGWTDKQIHQHEHGLNERTLTPAEDNKKEEMVMSMKKNIQGFKERYGDKAKSVMYATATKNAKRLAEEPEQLKELSDAAKQFVHHREHYWKLAKGSSKENPYGPTQTQRQQMNVHSKEMARHHKNMAPAEQHRAHTGSYVSSASKRLGGGSAKEDKEYVHEAAAPFIKSQLVNEELHAYDVHHKGKHIDTIFYGHHEDPEDVKRSLVHHDGYHPDIKVTKERKTTKEEVETVKEEALKPLTKYSYVPNRGHFVGGTKGTKSFQKHQTEYLKRKKLGGGVKEEVEQLDELSKGTLKSYIKKAVPDLKHHAGMSGYYTGKPMYRSSQLRDNTAQAMKSHDRKEKTRSVGISSAASKMEESSGTLKTVKSVLNEAFTRRHFKQIAELIKGHTDAKTRQRLADTHAAAFEKDNPRFDHARFHAAAGTVHKKD
jgi:hypothetical protein